MAKGWWSDGLYRVCSENRGTRHHGCSPVVERNLRPLVAKQEHQQGPLWEFLKMVEPFLVGVESETNTRSNEVNHFRKAYFEIQQQSPPETCVIAG